MPVHTHLQAVLLLISAPARFVCVRAQTRRYALTAYKWRMRILSSESVSVRLTQYLPRFSASATHIREACVQSVTNLPSQTLLGSASSASGPLVMTEALNACWEWMRAPGWPRGQQDRNCRVTDLMPATADMRICGRIKWMVLTVNAAQ